LPRGLRRKIKLVANESLRKDEAHATLIAGVVCHELHIEHASGTVSNPMTDTAIEEKFKANSIPIIGEDRATSICDTVWSLERQTDVRDLIALMSIATAPSRH
jgi:2-methylcitrate dehydratase PrpD